MIALFRVVMLSLGRWRLSRAFSHKYLIDALSPSAALPVADSRRGFMTESASTSVVDFLGSGGRWLLLADVVANFKCYR